MLLTCFAMERTFYSDYDGRLKLDHVLAYMRTNFEQYKEGLREQLKVRYQIEPPSSLPRVIVP